MFRVVRVYSDREGSELTARVCARITRDLDPSGWCETSWNTELFRSMKLQRIAAREAAAADIVILASREGISLPAEILQWMQVWRRRPRTTRSTLVALLSRDRLSAPLLIEECLHLFAARSRMDFLCHSRVVTHAPVWSLAGAALA